MSTAANDSVPRAPYRNAPIIEAVIDVHVTFPTKSVLPNLKAFADTLASEFPRNESMHQLEVQVAVGARNSQSSNVEQIGWKLFNARNDRVLQLQQKSFTYSHMAPYTEWNVFSSECKPLWRRFVEACRPVRVTRLGLRNINRLKLPTGDVELTNYLHFSPNVPATFGTAVGLLMRVQIPQPTLGPGGRSLITLASEQSKATDHQPMVLDIDVIDEGSWNADETILWQRFEQLREMKNELFETCITDSTRRLFA